MIENSCKCAKCVHKNVCALKENRSKLDSAINNLEKMSDYREFSMFVYCRYYSEEVKA